MTGFSAEFFYEFTIILLLLIMYPSEAFIGILTGAIFDPFYTPYLF